MEDMVDLMNNYYEISSFTHFTCNQIEKQISKKE